MNWINTESTDNASVEADIVFLSPKISGSIVNIDVIDNMPVSKGSIIANIDDTVYSAELDKAKIAVETAKEDFNVVMKQIELENINMQKFKSDIQYADVSASTAKNNLDRSVTLTRDSFSSKQAFENTQLIYDQAINQIAQLKLNIDSTHTKLGILKIQQKISEEKLLSAKSNLDIALYNQDATVIKSPIDGVASSSSLRIGTFVKAGMPVIAIVPTKNVYITANFKETQVAKLYPNMDVIIKIDAIPDQVFNGKIRSFYPATGSKFSLIPTDNATGNFTKIVQRISTIIDIDIPDDMVGKILPGMSTNVSIRTDQHPQIKASDKNG
jgi:membrane fusion protein (multidrug efflux system)